MMEMIGKTHQPSDYNNTEHCHYALLSIKSTPPKDLDSQDDVDG
jgi:hypothetical protein